ncbi:MAG TPA: HNH endonuclease signature motif containing protein [Pyrinomonadaceae bacterium]|nr:HNH endonuclease signature motif containing protein [Pyrinomonadaceae bacterium]
MSYISASLRKLVISRAGNRCEYCRLSQKGQEATFHIDHIYPFVLGGETVGENLALACVSCSLRKNAKEKVIDPLTKKEVPLFHTRKDVWNEHFAWKGVKIEGLTEIGRATVKSLNLNRPLILAIREEEKLLGRQES